MPSPSDSAPDLGPPQPATAKAPAVSPAMVVGMLGLLSLAAKLYCATVTLGSADVLLFHRFAGWIHESGLLAVYAKTDRFNHTPLTGWLIHGLYIVTGCAKDPAVFATLIRLPAIFADAIALGALFWLRQSTGKPGWPALALFAISPVAFMISGYHGNLDSVVALCMLLAAIACVKDRPALCGLFLGLSCNVKIVPLLVIPVFVCYWLHRRRLRPFFWITSLVVLAGWSYPLFTIPSTFVRNLFAYPSYWGLWGFSYLLRATGDPSFQHIATNFSPLQIIVGNGLKLLVVALALYLAWRGRKGSGLQLFRTLALVWAAFFSFAPGFGPQYLVWIAPFLLVANERWYTAVTLASSAALFVFYNLLSNGMPWYMGVNFSAHMSQFGLWFLLPWLAILSYFAAECWQARERLVASSQQSPTPEV